jgi:phytoene/squalene synthetase
MTSNHKTELDFTLDIDFGDIMTNPILDIAARFWNDDRYEAFKICYRSMRRIDDLVDDKKAMISGISKKDVEQLGKLISDWMVGVQNRDTGDTFQKTFLEILEKYKIPLWPWKRLCKAMIYDLEYDGYKSLVCFLRYSEGAAIAPASVFMHLCGIRRRKNEFLQPAFDIRKAARPLALFSYLVHIMRDFQGPVAEP